MSQDQKKKMLLGLIIITAILTIIILIILFVLMGIDKRTTKVVFKNVQYKTKTVDSHTNQGDFQRKLLIYNDQELPFMLETPDNKTYYCIETLTKLAGYKYNKGIYSETEVDESKSKCNIDNGGEYVNFIANENKIYKYIKVVSEYTEELLLVKDTKLEQNENMITEDEEIFTVEDNIILYADDKLYAPLDAITKGLNMGITFNDNIISIYTLEDMKESYRDALGKEDYSLTPNFRNQRSLCENLAVVGKNGKFGVVSTADDKYEEVISVKYDSVEYIQSIGQFIVSNNNNFGMIKPGEEKPTIDLQYDSISLMSAEKEFYIVKLDSKYGVVNAVGERVIPVEYDQIGLSDVSMYKGQGITNKYIIAGSCIPVMKNDLYGLYSLDGDCLRPTQYTSIGCANPSEILDDTTAMPTITLPLDENLTAIVVSTQNAFGAISYGLVATNGTVIQNNYYSAIYYTVKNGKTTYWFNKIDHELYSLDEFIETSSTAQEFIKNNGPQEDVDYEKNAKEEQSNLEKMNSEQSGSSSDDENDNNNDENNNGEEEQNNNSEE